MSSFWLILKQQWTIKISSPFFSIFSLVAILVGSQDHLTQFWKGAIQGPFHQSLVQIGSVASEELIKMWKVNGRTDRRQTTDDRWWTLSGDNELKPQKSNWLCEWKRLDTTQSWPSEIEKINKKAIGWVSEKDWTWHKMGWVS